MRFGMRGSRLCVPREVILDLYKSARGSSNELELSLSKVFSAASVFHISHQYLSTRSPRGRMPRLQALSSSWNDLSR